MKNYFLLIVTLFFLQSLFSQKSSPIAGHSSTLIDLLQKDYETSDAGLDFESIVNDQRIVIKIFKNYLHEDIKYNTKDVDKILYDLIKVEGERFINIGLKKISVKNFDSINKSIFLLSNKLVELKQKRDYCKELTRINSKCTDINFINDIRKIEKFSKKITTIKNVTELSVLFDAYDKNEYIQEILKYFITKYNNNLTQGIDNFISINDNASIQKSLPFIGGSLTFDTLVDGLSKFLVERIKQELSNYVINNIQAQLKKTKPTSVLNELVILLPKTVDFINQFDADELLNFTNNLKQYIQEDLNNILDNAYNLKTTARFKTLIDKNPDLILAFEAFQIYKQFSKLENPIDFFDILEQNEALMDWGENSDSEKKKNLVNTIKLVNLLAHSLTIVENGELRFVNTKFMSSYGTKPTFFMLYFGFLHQQDVKYYDIVFNVDKSNNFKLWDIKVGVENIFSVDDIKENTLRIKKSINLLSSIVKNAEKVYQDAKTIKSINKDDSKKLTPEQTHNFMRNFIGFLEQTTNSSFKMLTEFGLKNSENLKGFNNYINAANNVNNIVFDLQKKRYSKAIINAIELPLSLSKDETVLSNYNNQVSKIKNIRFFNLLRVLNSDYKKIKKEDIESLKLIILDVKVNINELKLTDQFLFHTKIDELSQKLAILNTGSVSKENLKEIKSIVSEITETFNMDDFKQKVSDKILKKLGIYTSIEEKLKEKLNLDKSIAKEIDGAFKFFLLAKTESYILQNENSNDELENLKALIRVHLPTIASSTGIINKKALKVISFIGDMANSETSEDVNKILNSYALPTGSYSAKRKMEYNVAINSYPGLIFGSESNTNANFSGGVTAPVGISARLFGAINIFLPIIDIAAPVRFRFDNSDNQVESTSDYTFKNIFSPGLYFSVPLGKSPFALNFGTQYGPNLRYKDGSVNATKEKESWSFNAAITIDIPIFTLYSKPKN